MLDDRVDLGFARGPVHEPSLQARTVLDEELVVALPLGHALGARKLVALSELATEPFLVAARSRGPGFHDHILSVCRAAGFSPRVVQEGSHLDILSLVAAGMGVAIVPASLRELRGRDLDYRSLRERPRTQLVAISRKTGQSPALREFLVQLDAPWIREEPRVAARAKGAPKRAKAKSR